MARAWIYDRQNDKGYRDAVARAKANKRTPPARWMVRYYDPAGRLKSAGTYKKKPAAEARQTEIEGQLSHGSYRDPAAGKVLVRVIAEAWWKAKADLEQGSRDLYRDHLDNYVLPRWGTTRVSGVRYQDVADWVRSLQVDPRKGKGDDPIGAATIRSVHLVMLSVMEWAVKSGHIPSNPARGVPLPKLPPRDHVYLSHPEVERLALAAKDATLIRLLAYTGLRWSEVSALTVGRLDLEARRAHIERAYKDNKGKLTLGTPKMGELRSVPVPAFLVGELKALVDGRAPEGLLFTAPNGGPIWLRNWRPRVFNKAVRDAKLTDRKITPHKLRHTAASLAIAAGADVYVVQTMLGHRRPSITLDTYGHLWPDRLDEVADALDAKRAQELAREERESAS